MDFYTFENKKMPWGDYGDTLLIGYAYPDKVDENKIYIERTGPFVPPIYEWAGIILVSETTKNKLEQSDLKGIEFIKTIFKKIVNINWTKWDLKADNPKIYPAGGEPENYIFIRKHNQEIASKMEPIWALRLNKETLIGRKQRNVSNRDELFVIENSWTGNDIFLGKGTGHVFFTKKAKEWFENSFEEYANFKSFHSKIATPKEIDFVLDYIKPVPVKAKPFSHLTPKDWKVYQKYTERAKKFSEKSKTDKTEKSKATSLRKAIESLEKAKDIRPLGKKEQRIYKQLTE